MHADFKATENKVNPRNYFVPNFGPDEDMINVNTSINNSEKRLNHKFTADFKDDENKLNPRGYFVPQFGLDTDIVSSLSNLRLEENIHGKWRIPGS